MDWNFLIVEIFPIIFCGNVPLCEKKKRERAERTHRGRTGSRMGARCWPMENTTRSSWAPAWKRLSCPACCRHWEWRWEFDLRWPQVKTCAVSVPACNDGHLFLSWPLYFTCGLLMMLLVCSSFHHYWAFRRNAVMFWRSSFWGSGGGGGLLEPLPRSPIMFRGHDLAGAFRNTHGRWVVLDVLPISHMPQSHGCWP